MSIRVNMDEDNICMGFACHVAGLYDMVLVHV